MSIIDERAPQANRRTAVDERLPRRGELVVSTTVRSLLDSLAEDIAREYIRLSSESLEVKEFRQASPSDARKE